MISRTLRFGLGRALSLGAVCLAINAPALAQEPMAEPTAEEPTPDPTLDASLTDDTETTTAASTEVPEAAPAEPAEEPAPEPAPVEEVAPPEPVVAETTDEEASEKDKTAGKAVGVKQLSIIQTPWTAYPSQYTRGLTYGSLWRTFHGQQWPYMPQQDKETNLQIGFSGYIWNDLNNARIDVAPSMSVGDQNRWTTQTRGVLRMTPTLNVGNKG